MIPSISGLAFGTKAIPVTSLVKSTIFSVYVTSSIPNKYSYSDNPEARSIAEKTSFKPLKFAKPFAFIWL